MDQNNRNSSVGACIIFFSSVARFWQTAKERDFQEVRALLYESLCKG